MVFLEALSIIDLNKIKNDLGIKKNYKSKNDIILSFENEFNKLSGHQQYDLLKKLNISYKQPKIITENFNRANTTDLKYTLFIKNIDYHKKKKDLLITINNINYYYSIPEKCIIHLQKLLRKYNRLRKGKIHGFTLFNRKLCNNSTEFMTFDNIEDIDKQLYISYKDKDKFYYGFDIRSINYMIDNKLDLINPYNRNKFPNIFLRNSNILINSINKNNSIKLSINSEQEPKTPEEVYKQDIMTICQKIDELGYYSILEWFIDLSIYQYKKFYEYLVDIWEYRLNLPISQKKKIVPPDGIPWRRTTYQINKYNNIVKVRKSVLYSINKLLNSSTNIEEQKLGCMYILMALTMVNNIAAQDLPWLYQSVMLI